MGVIKKKKDHWQEYGEIETLIHCCCECKIRNNLAVPQKVKPRVTIPPNSFIPKYMLMGIENIHPHKNLFITMLFIIAEMWK